MVKADLKRDKMGHVKNEEMGTEAKSTKLPGQMYVPKKHMTQQISLVSKSKKS
jgi:hypothetical protein